MSAAQVITALILVIAYGTWAYFHPWRACPRCQASGKNRLSTRRRSGKCRRCKGTREVQTRGSQMLHRAVRSARGYRNNRKDS